MSLSREDLLTPSKPVIESVPVPEWATEKVPPEESFVRVRVMSGTERDAYEMGMYEAFKGGDTGDGRAKLVVRCLCDENGSLLLGLQDVNAIGSKNGCALDRVASACQRINGLGDAAMEKVVKNSRPSLGDVPSLASP